MQRESIHRWRRERRRVRRTAWRKVGGREDRGIPDRWEGRLTVVVVRGWVPPQEWERAMYGAERVGGGRMRWMVGEEGGPTSRMRLGRGGGGGGGWVAEFVGGEAVGEPRGGVGEGGGGGGVVGQGAGRGVVDGEPAVFEFDGFVGGGVAEGTIGVRVDAHGAVVFEAELGVGAVLGLEIGEEVEETLEHVGAVGTAVLGVALDLGEGGPAVVALGDAEAAVGVAGGHGLGDSSSGFCNH